MFSRPSAETRFLVLGCVVVLAFSLLAPGLPTQAQETVETIADTPSEPSTGDSITLDKIMSDPQWLGRQPDSAYFSDDSQSVYYQRDRADSALRDWFEVDLQGNLLRRVEDQDLGRIDHRGGQWDRQHKRKIYEREGDLFLKIQKTGKIRQLTRTSARESSPRFMADGQRILFRRGTSWLVRHLKSGLEEEWVDLRTEKDPEERRKQSGDSYLEKQQQALFDVLRQSKEDQEERRQANQQQAKVDPTRSVSPWYLGDQRSLGQVQLSPNGRWCLVVLESRQSSRGQNDKMPQFVDDSGYVQSREVRPLVGTGKAVSDQLVLLDLKTRTRHTLSWDALPMVDDDPLVPIREAAKVWRASQQESSGDRSSNESAQEGETEKTPSDDKSDSGKSEEQKTDSESGPSGQSKGERTIQVNFIRWNDLGNQVVVELSSADNKDRWLTTVQLDKAKLNCFMHRRDPAWINYRMGQTDWLADQQTVYYLAEKDGYAHLYTYHVPSGAERQLTRGEYVVSSLQPSTDGKRIYYQANVDDPGIYEIYRVDVSSGETEALTELGGINDFVLADDQSRLLITHSTAMSPPELWIQPLDGDEPPRPITRTVSAEFTQMPWIAPQFVQVPSRAGRDIRARLYLPPGHDPDSDYPAVIFIHGAGYLQNAHQGWSSYFREFMFHSLLAHRGYVVLDMDYRGSAGYGRDWRTAIYRQMGHPEVEDLEDGLHWLVQQHGVTEDRVGLYGGSYGGFLTMMALFRRPGVFACGAALRPVTDWAHYNHGYTSNILNTPDDDPEAYAVSSPIEFAEGLSDPLLICHGMVDDNVFFKDTARLAQRLIELKKSDWEVAIYPVEPHGFREPTSWYDEYRRILALFERHLRDRE